MNAPAILPTERAVQRAILAMCGTCFRDVLIHHSPNGAHLAGDSVARFKQMGALLGDGTKRGWPDLVCHWADGKTAYLEIKRPKTGRLSDDQKAVHAKLAALGIPIATVTSPEEAFDFLLSCDAPCSARMRTEPF